MTVIFKRFYYYSVYFFFFIDIYIVCYYCYIVSVLYISIFLFSSHSFLILSLSFIDMFYPLVYHICFYSAAVSLVSFPRRVLFFCQSWGSWDVDFFFFFLVFINLFYLLGSVCSPLKHSCFTELNIRVYTEFNLWTFSPTDFSLIIFITVIYTSETKHNLINYSCHMKSLNFIKWCSWTCSALILPRMF